eukprot:c26244_g1_i1 orf=398-1516(+)
MLQDPAVKPPDEIEMHTCSTTAVDRRQKTNSHSEQPMKCPRCDSPNTKFCYYNNYSLTQPRYFCKSCRRYWTKGGALRNVPIGGGCRKNKRVKRRTVDGSSFVALDERTSNMLANINSSNCSSLPPNFSGPSSSSFVDLSDTHRFGNLSFCCLQESLRLGEQSGAAPSNTGMYGISVASNGLSLGSATEGILDVSCSQPTLVSNLPSFDSSFMNLSYPRSTVTHEQSTSYTSSDFSSLFETPAQMSSATTALTSLEDQFSTPSVPAESFNCSSVDTQMRLQQQKLALQLVNEIQNGDHCHILPSFEEDARENLRRIKGKSVLPSWVDLRPHLDWQGVTENFFETTGESTLWNCPSGWADLQALTSSASGGML